LNHARKGRKRGGHLAKKSKALGAKNPVLKGPGKVCPQEEKKKKKELSRKRIRLSGEERKESIR